MERFKEKKQNIVDALREACDAIYPSTNLEAIQEIVIGFLSHKTPVVRQQVALFLVRCFSMSTQTTLPKKVLKLYLPPLIKVIIIILYRLTADIRPTIKLINNFNFTKLNNE
jgi:cytoskeleton-associated protein 5